MHGIDLLTLPAYLDGVISQTRDDLVIVVLKAINSFAVFTSAVDALEIVSSYSPIVLNGVDVFNDLRVEIAVVLMRGRGLVDWLVFK